MIYCINSVAPYFHFRSYVFQWTFVSITATSHQTFDLSVHLVKYHSKQEVLREEKNLAQDLQLFSEVDPNDFFSSSFSESCLCSCLSLWSIQDFKAIVWCILSPPPFFLTNESIAAWIFHILFNAKH